MPSASHQSHRRRSNGQGSTKGQPDFYALSLSQLRETLVKTERLLATLPSASAASSSQSAPDPIVTSLMAQRQAMRDREAELLMDQLKLEQVDVKGKGRAREVVGDDGLVRGMTRKESVIAAIDQQEKRRGVNGHVLLLEASLALDTRETEQREDAAMRFRQGASSRTSKEQKVGPMDEISRAQLEARMRAFMTYAPSESDSEASESGGIYLDDDDLDDEYTTLNPSQPSHLHPHVSGPVVVPLEDEDDMFPEGNDDLEVDEDDLGGVIQVDVERALGGDGLQVPMES